LVQNSEQFRQSDVTVWGMAALVCVGLAVLGANVAGVIPSNALNALHSPRNDATSLAQLRQQVAELRSETALLRRQNEILTTRFALQERSGNETVRRVGALEVAMPVLADIRPVIGGVDRSVTTASIAGQKFEAEGGTVVVRQSTLQQPLPAPITQASAASGVDIGYAVAIGPSFASGQAPAQWHDFEVRLGSVLSEMKPLVADATERNQQRLVVGPIPQLSDARDLCQRLEQMEIACTPANYSGEPLN
jgi:hypothetical protein